MAILRQLRRAATLANIEFWETENIWRLHSSLRGAVICHIRCLLDAPNVRAVSESVTQLSPRAGKLVLILLQPFHQIQIGQHAMVSIHTGFGVWCE